MTPLPLLRQAALCVCFAVAIRPVALVYVQVGIVDAEGRNAFHAASPVAGKSPEEAAALFCEAHVFGDAEAAACTAGLGAELARRSADAYGNASVLVQSDGGMDPSSSSSPPHVVWTLVAEDPGTASRRWCTAAQAQVTPITLPLAACVADVRARLWAELEFVHRARLEGLLRSGVALPLVEADATEARLDQVHGSVAVLRLRVRELAAALDAAIDASDDDAAALRGEGTAAAAYGSVAFAPMAESVVQNGRALALSLELLGLAELAAGFTTKAKQRFLEALALAAEVATTASTSGGRNSCDAAATLTLAVGPAGAPADAADAWALQPYVRAFSEELATAEATAATTGGANPRDAALTSAAEAVDAAVASRRQKRAEAAALRQWWRAGRRPTDPDGPAARPSRSNGQGRQSHARQPLPRLTAAQLRAGVAGVSTGAAAGDGGNDDDVAAASLVAAALRGEVPFVLTGAMDAWDWVPDHDDVNHNDDRSKRGSSSDGIGSGDGTGSSSSSSSSISNSRGSSRSSRSCGSSCNGTGSGDGTGSKNRGSSDDGLLARLVAGWGGQRNAVEWFPEGLGSVGQFKPAPLRPSLSDALAHLSECGGACGYAPPGVDVAQGGGAYVHWGVSSKDWPGVLAAFATPAVAVKAAAVAQAVAEVGAVAPGAVAAVAAGAEPARFAHPSLYAAPLMPGSPEAAAAALEALLLPPLFAEQHWWMHACFKDNATYVRHNNDPTAAEQVDNSDMAATARAVAADNAAAAAAAVEAAAAAAAAGTTGSLSATVENEAPVASDEWRRAVASFVGLTRWFVVYVGEAGGGMFNHFDRHMTSAWQAQVRGTKRWHLCSPDQAHLMYGRGGVDVFAPDYANKPLILGADCFDDVVLAGEMVFYPGGWWHATQTLSTPTVSVSALTVDQRNRKDFAGAIHEECTPPPAPPPPQKTAMPSDHASDRTGGASSSQPRANFPPALCHRLLGRCLPLLEKLYGEREEAVAV